MHEHNYILILLLTLNFCLCDSERSLSFKATLTKTYPAYEFIRTSPILQNLKYKIPKFTLSIGEPSKNYWFTLSTDLYLTWIADSSLNKTFLNANLYNKSDSSSFISQGNENIVNVHHHKLKMNGIIISDLIHVGNTSKRFNFTLVENTNNKLVMEGLSGVIGIMKSYLGSSTYSSFHNSFIDTLIRGEIIDKRKFSFDFYSKNKSEHEISFGKTYSGMKYCDSNFRYLEHLWYCDLKTVSFNGKNFTTNEALFFESTVPYFILSDKIGEEIFKEITEKYSHCKMMNGEINNFILCEGSDDGIIEEEIIYELDYQVYVNIKFIDIMAKGYYELDGKRVNYYVPKIFWEKGADSCVFGALVFKNRRVTFDTDNHCIGFSQYNNGNIIDIRIPEEKKIKIIFLIINILCSFSIISLINLKIKFKLIKSTKWKQMQK